MATSSIPAIIAARRASGDGAAQWSSPMAELPADIEDILKCAAGDTTSIAAAAGLANTRPVVAESACRWFIRHVLFRPTASYYWNLGVTPDAGIDIIRAHYRHLISIFHPDRLQQSDEQGWYEGFAKRVNEAYNTLKNSESRGRYDRLQQVALSQAVPPSKPSADSGERDERDADTPRGGFRRAAVHGAPTRGAWTKWADERRPATLKLLTFAGLVVVAVAGVLMTRAHKDRPTDIALPSYTPAAARRDSDREQLADLLARANPPGQAAVPLSAPRIVPPAPVSSGSLQPLHGSASSANTAPIATAQPRVPSVSSEHATRESSSRDPAIVPAPPIAAARPAPTTTASSPPMALPASEDDGARQVATRLPSSELQTVPPTVAPRLARPDTAAVDLLLSRFADAYNAGDMRALMALIDPEASRGDQMAFALANFSQLFRDSSSRRIEMHEVQRTADNERLRVQLDTSVVIVTRQRGARTDLGELTLVVRTNGEGTFIAEMSYRGRAA